MPASELRPEPLPLRGLARPEQHAATREFFEPRLARVTGGPRAVEQMLEKIQLCVALIERTLG